MTSPPVATLRRCVFCEAAPVAWMHRLDLRRARFVVDGDEHVWAGELPTCARCEGLLRSGDDDHGLLGPRLASDFSYGDEGERAALAGFRAGDLGATPVGDWLPPGSTELAADGFVLLEDLPFQHDLVLVWPAEHQSSVPETRTVQAGIWPDGRCRLVRSPWPGVDVSTVVDLMVAWVQRQDPRWDRWNAPEDDERRLAIERDFFVAFDAAFREEWDRHLRDWM